MGFKPHEWPLKLKAVNKFANRMKSTLDKAQAALVKSKDDMACYYNQRWTPAPKFTAGKKVFLDASDISTTRPMKKFAHWYLGPYSIVLPIGLHAYHLKMPPSMSGIHPVFHVIKLKLVPPDLIEGRVARLPPPLDIVEGEERYEVEEVINSQFYYWKLQFLVKWKGYGHEENSWISERDIDAPALIMDFYKANPAALKQISAITFGWMGFWLWDRGWGWRRGHMHWDAVPWRGGDVRRTPAETTSNHHKLTQFPHMPHGSTPHGLMWHPRLSRACRTCVG